MRNRIDVLKDLVFLNKNLATLRKELSNFPWDTKEPCFIIYKDHVLNIIIKVISEEITFRDMEKWANEIECRDDLDFENKEIQEYIFEFASPEINGKITKKRLMEIFDRLTQSKD